MMEQQTQTLALDVLVNGEVTTYAVQAWRRHSAKNGEPPYHAWSFILNNITIEEAEYSINQWKEDGFEARIVKITTKADIL